VSSHGIRDKVAIVGVGCTQFGERWDQSAEDMLIDASHEALASARVSIESIDAFWLGTLAAGHSGLLLSGALRTDYKPVTRVENYCATGSEAFRAACYAVASGAYDVAMAVGVEKLKDSGFSGLVVNDPPNDGSSSAITGPAAFSFLAPAYCETYGVTHEQLKDTLSRIAWKNHANGALNPRAQFRREVPLDQIRASPLVAGMLGIFDCSGVSDGAAAAIVVPAERALEYTDRPLYVKALSLAASPTGAGADPGNTYVSIREVVRSAADAYEQAGISNPRDELALAEVHDCFTPTELVLMEDLGFSERGSAWKDVLDGVFDRDGVLPVNPDGGLKSFGHPIGASGLRMLYECWLQLRGEAGDRQIASIRDGSKPTRALTHNLGGTPGACVSFVGIVGSELDT
jgi:acetyl-CoA C-acetyltransferase